ncbi:MAG: ATP-dependent helicase [Bacteroidota bacterium]|nr:ATP-dependent helicase [Bacteroidota bacterium]MDE2644253.1 ATP-dependent helicase [Bacteroidota bacterium]
MIRLSPEQKQIVETQFFEAVQVLASAGAGKTRVLTERVRFILENTKREWVIALTFTNKAAEEMKARLFDCDEATERAWVATIHSVAERILRQYGYMMGLPEGLHIYERDKDRMDVFIQSLRDNWIDVDDYLRISNGEVQNRERVLREYLNAFSVIKRELLGEEDTETRFNEKPGLWKVFREYQDALLGSGGIDYDDILVYARKLLINQTWIADIYRAKYKHICVDEAQDLNLLQYEFLRAFCGDRIRSVMMVGDPDQMIYGFNGSSSDYLCEHFVRDFSAKKYELTQNYRSSSRVINAANNLKLGAQQGGTFALEGRVRIESLPDEVEESKWIVSSIKSLIRNGRHEEIEGDISLERMVIIARNRFVFSTLKEMLVDNSIPFFLKKAERATEPVSILGKILDYGIRVKLNPRDWVDGKKLCCLLGVEPPEKWQDENILKHWSDEIDTSSPMNSFRSDLLLAIHELDPSEPNIEKFKISLFPKLDEVAGAEADHAREIERSMEELQEFYRTWIMFRAKGLGTSLRSFQSALALGQLVQEETRATEGRLMLSTVHTMKGLEKDIVFIMTMCEGIFPDYRAKSEDEIDEERNNAFVAVTRAKRWLYITYPEKRTMPWGDERNQVESRFIGEIRGNNLRTGPKAISSKKNLETAL